MLIGLNYLKQVTTCLTNAAMQHQIEGCRSPICQSITGWEANFSS